MIRIVVFLLVLAGLALGGAWLADRPGEIVMTWQHWRISTSLTVAVVLFALAVLFAMLVWTAVRFILRTPDVVALFFRERRRARGWRAITNGLVAVGTGNATLARRAALEARKFAGDQPLTLLLAAQAAQLGGDGEKAEAEFRAMLGRSETRLLGLRGLYIEAVRRDDAAAARAYAQEAAQSPGAPGWAAEALIEFQCRAGDWSGALASLEAANTTGAFERALVKRRRAVLLTAEAQALEETDPGRARELAVEAAKLAPDLVPAAALAGRLLGVEGSQRRAAGILEKAWTIMPHPDLAEAYAHLQPGDAAADRLKRVKRLVRKKPDHAEAALALARAALEAGRFEEARQAMTPLLDDPTQRACLLMAEIEATEHGDHGKAREWTVRALRAARDPAWVADGYVAPEWLPASPRSGALDAFVWTVPQTALAGPVIEQAAEQALAIPLPPPAAMPPASQQPPEAPPQPEPEPSAVEVMAESMAQAAPIVTPAPAPIPMPAAVPTPAPAKHAEAVAPLVAEPPLPDDPGPDAADATDAEGAGPARRSRLFGWFGGAAS